MKRPRRRCSCRSAAARAGRLSEEAHIVASNGTRLPFAQPAGLPTTSAARYRRIRAKPLLVTPEGYAGRFSTSDARTVLRFGPMQKDPDRGTRPRAGVTTNYDNLRGRRLRPPIPGVDLPGIFTSEPRRRLQSQNHRARARGKRVVETLGRRHRHDPGRVAGSGAPPLDKEIMLPCQTPVRSDADARSIGRRVRATADGMAVRLKSGESLSGQIRWFWVSARKTNWAVDAGCNSGPAAASHPGRRLTGPAPAGLGRRTGKPIAADKLPWPVGSQLPEGLWAFSGEEP